MIRTTVAGVAVMLAATGAMALPAYEIANESFENVAPNPYLPGAFSSADARWTVQEEPVMIVENGNSALGGQFVQLGSGAILDFSLSETDKAGIQDMVWVEGYFRGVGSDVTLAEANYPITQASAIVHFSSANGIEVWDGTKNGASAPTSLNVPLGADNSDNWYKITIALDFSSKTWDVWVNNEKKNAAALGFRDNTVTNLNGFKNLAQGGADFDGFRIVRALMGDINGDSARDTADVVRLLEYIASPPTDDAILLGNLNVTTSGDTPGSILNAEDVTVLVARIMGAMP